MSKAHFILPWQCNENQYLKYNIVASIREGLYRIPIKYMLKCIAPLIEEQKYKLSENKKTCIYGWNTFGVWSLVLQWKMYAFTRPEYQTRRDNNI